MPGLRLAGVLWGTLGAQLICLLIGLDLFPHRLLAAEPPAGQAAPPATADPAQREALLKQRDAHQEAVRALQSEGKLPEAIAEAEQMLAAEREALGPDHDDVDGSHLWLAELYALQGDFDHARQSARQSLDNQLRLHGKPGPAVAVSRQALAFVNRVAELKEAQRGELQTANVDYLRARDFYNTGRPKAALEPASRAAPLFRKLLGDGYRKTAHVLRLLGYIQSSLHKESEAAAAHSLAVASCKQSLGDVSPDLAVVLTALGGAESALGNFDKAVAAYRQAAGIQRQLLGKDNKDTHAELSNLARVSNQRAQQLETAGELAAARQARKETLEGLRQFLPADHWRVVNARVALDRIEKIAGLSELQRPRLIEARQQFETASRLYGERKYAEAAVAARAAMQTRSELLGQDSSDVALATNLLALALDGSGAHAESVPLLKQAQAIWTRSSGERHPEVATCLQNLTETYLTIGDLPQAERCCREAFEIRLHAYGKQDSDTLTSLRRLGEILARKASRQETAANFAAAEQARQQVLELFQEQYGAQDYRTVDARVELEQTRKLARLTADQHTQLAEAATLAAQAAQALRENKLADALPAAEKSLEMRLRLLGAAQPATLWSQALRAESLLRNGDLEAASPLCTAAVEVAKTLYGPRHPEVAESLTRLARLETAKHDLQSAREHSRQAYQAMRASRGANDDSTINAGKMLVSLLNFMAEQAVAKDDFETAKGARKEQLELQAELNGPEHYLVAEARWLAAYVDEQSALPEEQRKKLRESNDKLTEASTLGEQKSVAQAAVAAAGSASLRKECLGTKHLAYALARMQWSVLKYQLGDKAESAEGLAAVADVLGQTLGEDHPNYLTTLSRLAEIQLELRADNDLAITLQKALAVREKLLGFEHRDTKDNALRLLAVLQRQAPAFDAKPDRAAAKKTREQIIVVLTKLYGEKNWQANDNRWAIYQADLLAGLQPAQRQQLATADKWSAQSAQSLKKIEEMEQSFPRPTQQQKEPVAKQAVQAAAQAVQLRKQILGAGNPRLADAYEALAAAQRAAADFAGAKSSYQQSLEIRKKTQGIEHPAYLQAYSELSGVVPAVVALPFVRPTKLTPAQQQLIAQRDRWEALAKKQRREDDAAGERRSYLAMLQIERQVYGETHLEVALSYERLAELALSDADWATARSYQTKIVEIYTKLYGPPSWQATEARFNIADTTRISRLSKDKIGRLIAIQRAPSKLAKVDSFGGGSQADNEAALKLARETRAVVRDVMGEAHPYYANALEGEAQLLTISDPAKADELYREAAAVTRLIYGNKHPLYLVRLNRLAAHYFFSAVSSIENGQFAQAEKWLEQRIEIQKLHYGEQHWQVAKARTRLEQCRKLAKLSAADRKQLQEVEYEINSLNRSLGEGYGEEDPAKRRAWHALYAKLFGPENPDTIDRLHELGAALRAARDFSQAAPILRETLALRRKVFGAEHPATARAMNDLGLAYYALGNYVAAEPLLREARETLEKLGRDRDPVFAASLNNLAVLYEALGDYDRAEPLLRQVVNMRVPRPETLDVDPDEDGWNNSAGKYTALMGEFNVAVALHMENVTAEAPKEADLRELSQYLNNLALLYRARGDNPQAETLIRQSLGLLLKQENGEKSPECAVSLSNLAAVYQAQGDLDQAKVLLDCVVHIRKQTPSDPKYATAINNLGALEFRRGNLPRAAECWGQALELRRKLLGEGNPNTVSSLAGMALLADRQGQPAQAAELWDQVLDRAANNLQLAAAIQSERQQLLLRQAQRGYLDEYLALSARSNLPPEQVYRHVLAWKGAVAVQQQRLRDLRRVSASQNGGQVAKLYQRLSETNRQLGLLTFNSAAHERADAARQEIDRLSMRKDELERQLAELGGKLAPPLNTASPADIQKLLPEKTVLLDLIEYAATAADAKSTKAGERRLGAFAIRKGQPIAFRDLGPAAPVEVLVDRLRQVWLRGKRAGDSDPAAELRKLIWTPLEADLAGADTLLVSPDGPLARLPWGALPGKAAGTYLVEDLAIAVVPAPQLLVQYYASPRADRSSESPAMVLLGDVDFGADPGGEKAVDRGAPAPRAGKPLSYAGLPGSLTEIDSLQKLYAAKFESGRLARLDGARATETALRQQASTARYLHLATHGFFAPAEVKPAARRADPLSAELDQPDRASGWNPGLLSGIVLAGVNLPVKDGRDDGVLTAAEVADLDLSATDLVVLSACETGLGQVAGGEGTLGLQRSLQIAGARAVVSSLWKVDDAATQLLMRQFYENLWSKNLPPLAAFRQAQLSLLNGTVDTSGLRGLEVDAPAGEDQSQGRLSPRLWAAFVLSGDPQ